MAVLDGAEQELAVLQVVNDNDGYRAMLRLARRCGSCATVVVPPAHSYGP